MFSCGVTNVGSNNTIALVSCAKGKVATKCEARSLYSSQLFTKASRWVEGNYHQWFILSALYGLLPPDTTVAPYDLTLNGMSSKHIKDWTEGVAKDVVATGADNVHIYAGKNYRKFLVPILLEHGIQVTVPLSGLGIGKQLAWYKIKEQQCK